MNSKIIFIIIIVLAKAAQSIEVKENYKCKAEATKQLLKQQVLNTWQAQAPTKKASPIYRSPTTTLGKWIELRILNNQRPQIVSITNKEKIEIDFDQNCRSIEIKKAGLDFSKKIKNITAGENWLTDQKLEKLVKKSKSGVLYVWSPEMTYSAQYYKYFRTAAQNLKVDFTLVLDPRTDLKNINYAIKNYGMPAEQLRLNSVELYMRNTTVHYPTAVIYRDGKISRETIIGVKNTDQLEKDIARNLFELR